MMLTPKESEIAKFAQRVTEDEKGVGKQPCLISETGIIALKG